MKMSKQPSHNLGVLHIDLTPPHPVILDARSEVDMTIKSIFDLDASDLADQSSGPRVISGFWRRLLAFILDGLMLGLVGVVRRFDSFHMAEDCGQQYGPIVFQRVLVFCQCSVDRARHDRYRFRGRRAHGRTVQRGFLVGLAFPLAPFLLIGMIAGVASLRGTMIGRCTWLGGLAPVLALEFIGLLEYRQGIRNHAGTGGALVFAMAVCAALPASIVGSLIGLRIGSAISKRQDEPTVDGKPYMENIAEDPGAAPDRGVSTALPG
jgi:hypothetical protein